MTELTLQLGPPTHARFDTVWKKGDETIADDIMMMLADTPRMLVVWRPDMGRYNAVRLREVPTSVAQTGATQTIEMPEWIAAAGGATIRTWEVRGWLVWLWLWLRLRQLAACGSAGQRDQPRPAASNKTKPDQEMARPPFLLEEVMCGISKEVSLDHGWASNLRGRVLMSGVGATNAMQSVGCGDRCAWDAGISNLAMWDTHFTTELSALPQWMADVKAILEKDFWVGAKGGLLRRQKCLPPGYFWLRFGSGNNDLISPAAGLNGTVHLQLSFMTSKATVAKWGIKHGYVLEVLEQLTLCK